ncbi:MAG: CPBP family intramembrane metalloprotease [Candidatus Omnitrophica bacterium]|nr:CPBP family intramembrane metalloprotease [Candidatus Omnitrophota bacterium]
MSKFTKFIRENRLYLILFIFVLCVNILILKGTIVEKNGIKDAGLSEEFLESGKPKKSLFDEEDIALRQKKFEKLIKENPSMGMFFAFFNMAVFYVLFLGIGIDIYLISRWIKKKTVKLNCVEQKKPLWSIPDIIRVVLIFLSIGYVFMIVQEKFANRWPLLYNENFRMVFNTASMNIIVIGVIMYFVVSKYGQSIKEIGLSPANIAGNIFYAVIGYIAIIPIIVLIMTATFFTVKWIGYKPPVQPIVRLFAEEKIVSVLWMSTIFAAIFGPVAEEIFFRGFMYPAVKKKMGIFLGIMITSFLFALLHAHIVGFLPIMVLGVLLVYLYEKTGSIVPSIIVHIMHNVSMLVIVFITRSIGV